jgi:hypothetical protein
MYSSLTNPVGAALYLVDILLKQPLIDFKDRKNFIKMLIIDKNIIYNTLSIRKMSYLREVIEEKLTKYNDLFTLKTKVHIFM